MTVQRPLWEFPNVCGSCHDQRLFRVRARVVIHVIAEDSTQDGLWAES